MKKPITIDFETEAIEPRPAYPPKPIGVAIWVPGNQPRYYAWEHPTGNNCTYDVTSIALNEIWNGRYENRPLLFHNAPFDLEVAHKWFDLPYPPWHRVHDTMLLCFLNDPYATTLSLKPQADKWLDMPPEEQDELRDWIFDNVPGSKRAKKKWAKHIAKTPGNLCEKYAIGDVVRTRKLFDLIYRTVNKKAYDRERELQPILFKAEQTGVKLAIKKLKRDLYTFESSLEIIDNSIRKILGNPNLEVDKTKDLADAIDHKGFVDSWPLTPTGKRSVAAKILVEVCTNKELVNFMLQRGRLKTGLRSFGRPWLAATYNGRMHTHWNQVRNDEAARQYGARTGRLSSNPNFQNLPKDPMQGMPHPRSYIVPEKGNILLGRDYAQQELRILAWKIGGEVAKKYAEKPDLDLHEYARTIIYDRFGFMLDRKIVKTLAFGLIYGMGAKRLADSLGIDIQEARKFNNSYIDILPGFRELQSKIKYEREITTWGGRHYQAEEPITKEIYQPWTGEMIKFVERDFAYKLLNYLIQGSAAECTKQAIINYHNATDNGIFLLSAHDEILIECPKEIMHSEMGILEQSMRDVDFKPIPMLSDGKYSYKNWSQMREYR